MTFQRYTKYEVMKVNDIDKYLNNVQKTALEDIIQTIQESRTREGKPACNRYVVVNEDQPYAEVVWKLIEIQETDPSMSEDMLKDIDKTIQAYENTQEGN
ncbi:hypothetical protein LCGC14_1896850 [marine sediment metagenome]|uniref:Uncharacterized protein n=1 Tax=marine sediment metagenome TaxID=412755 RepID=A0A0F9FY03_9ZZZZ